MSAKLKNPPGPTDCEKVSNFMRGMVDHVRMKIMIEPSTAWCNDEGNEGITSTVVLTTSHCAMHIWNFPEPNESVLQFDLYSCAPFTAVEVIEYIAQNFDVTTAKYKFLDREDDFVEVDNGKVTTGFAGSVG